MDIYFSEKFTNLKNTINLKFSKKITKNEKNFFKLLFFRIASDYSFLEKAAIRLEELLSILEFPSINNFTPFFNALMVKHIFFSTDMQFSGSFGIISSFVLYSDYCHIFFTEEFKNCFSLKKNFFSLLEIEKSVKVFISSIAFFKIYFSKSKNLSYLSFAFR